MQKISGTHLIVDGYVKDPNVFSESNMLQLFDKLVESLDMQYLTPPMVTPVELEPEKLETDDDEGGVSYFCQITTSHIAAHTWELRGAIMLDVFSCKPFDFSKAFAVLDKHLGFEYYDARVVDRADPNGSCFGPRAYSPSQE